MVELNKGDHVGLLFEDPAEQLSVAAEFIKEGIRQNERCVYIADERTQDELAGALSAAGIDIESALARGALSIVFKHDSVFGEGTFNAESTSAFFRGLEQRSLAEGFSGLRVAGEMAWALCASGDPVAEYESLLNELAAKSRISFLCQYDRAKLAHPCIHEVFRTHAKVFLDRRVSSNPYYHLQTLSRRLLEVQESERRHLARELHDEVGQLLTGLRLLLKPSDNLPAETRNARLDQARSIVDKLLERIRGLSFDLHPATLDQLGLIPTLVALFERFSEQTGVLVNFKHNGIEGRAAPDVETAAYRVVQEALTNVARHAGVAGANVRVWTTENTLNLQIEDRGRGFDPEAAMSSARSSGLSGMHERVLLLHGNLTIDSQPGKGTQITAELPLNRTVKKEPS